MKAVRLLSDSHCRQVLLDMGAEVILVSGQGDIMGITTLDQHTADGRAPDCDCQLLSCVCQEVRKHQADCRYRKAISCFVPIVCDHGYDACPECDPCGCPSV